MTKDTRHWPVRLFSSDPPAQQFVAIDGDDDNDGLSLETAKRTIEAAMRALYPDGSSDSPSD